MSRLSLPEFSILLGEIQCVWGKEIKTIRDCESLSEDIFLKTKERISPSTLFRWFVMKNHANKPYQSTLNTLQWYIHLDQSTREHQIVNERIIFPDHQGLDFIALSLQHGECKGLLAYLNKMPNYHVDIDQSINFASRIGKEIRNSTYLQKHLIPELNKSEQGRLFLLELFCDQDALEGYYHHALEEYISVFPNKNKIKVLEDFLFASHLLTQSYLLRKEFDSLKTLKLEYEKLLPEISKNYEALHPMPRLRFHLLDSLLNELGNNSDSRLENQTIIKIDAILHEFHEWGNAILFETAKTAAILHWKDTMDYVLKKQLEQSVSRLSCTNHYAEYTLDILNRFAGKQLDLATPTSDYRHIEYTRYNNHILSIYSTLNNLK